MRPYLALAIDLGWVALSAIVAVLIRDNFVLNPPHLQAVTAYAAIAVATSALVFVVTGLHRRLWQYTSLPDVLRIMAAVTVALLLALFISFVSSRLENVARSVPVIQWFLLVGAILGTRVAVRIWFEQARREQVEAVDASIQHVLVVGLSHVTELYLESVAEYAAKTVDVVGILSEKGELRGRSLRFQKVLGTPEELQQVMAQLEVHGVTIERIVVTQPPGQLSRRAREALFEVESSSGVRVDWMVDLLGLAEKQERKIESAPESSAKESPAVTISQAETPSLGRYGYVKRALDISGAISFSILLAPLIFVTGLFVALDVGFPLIFWQKRPGRHGRPFRLFKFCTMRPAHDAEGKRVSDEERSSIVGELLRRTRLDELPQLYNVLIGEMSLVGPRPLLPLDQPFETRVRLSVRPGLTGLAQVRGGRNISAEDKNALDVWYVRNASPWLDIEILLRTPIVVMRGERVDPDTLHAVRTGPERLQTPSAANPDAYALMHNGAAGDGQVESVHPVI
jgi:lipopolysaccharide/colanic/teichoic acid biosynthesis glycosyltransferase